jgi:hypothetical protein
VTRGFIKVMMDTVEELFPLGFHQLGGVGLGFYVHSLAGINKAEFYLERATGRIVF